MLATSDHVSCVDDAKYGQGELKDPNCRLLPLLLHLSGNGARVKRLIFDRSKRHISLKC